MLKHLTSFLGEDYLLLILPNSSFAFFASSRFNHTNFSDPKTVIKQQTDRATVRRIAGEVRSLLSSNLCDKMWKSI
ncbi:hypothetical protein QUA00_20990 [Microcoleus sp. T2B6]|uniref:hypothetical protein n=1 Tax=Microcoleus sp. T2B6 TaxID=3055424 RepID=UPI002FCF9F4D